MRSHALVARLLTYKTRRLNLSGNILRSLSGIEQFASLQQLHVGMNCISDPRELLHLPPSLTALHVLGNPCCSCPCARAVILSACPSIKTIDSQPVLSWHIAAAAAAPRLQSFLACAVVGASVLHRALATAAQQVQVNAEFAKLFGQQQDYHEQRADVLSGLAVSRSLFASFSAAAEALNAQEGSESTGGGSSSSASAAALAATHMLSSLPDLTQFLEAGIEIMFEYMNHKLVARNKFVTQ